MSGNEIGRSEAGPPAVSRYGSEFLADHAIDRRLAAAADEED